MHAIHDAGYKKLFSNKTIFRELIQTFVREKWVKDLDFEQCEALDKSFVADHYKETESDLIYNVKFRGLDAYLFVLLEFQSSVDRFMAVRVLSYVTSFYLDYVRDNKHVRKLPPLFLIVLYNGDRRWSASTTLSALLQDPALLGKYTPRFQYFKVAEREYSKEELLRIRNIVSTLFLAEAYYDRELIINECVNVFRHEDDRQAVSLLVNWFRQLMEHGEVEADDYRELEFVYHDVEEAKGMLITALEKERKRMRAEMRAELIEEVREEVRTEERSEGEHIGLIKGLQEGVILSLEIKFGEAALLLLSDLRQIHDVALLQELIALIKTNAPLNAVADVIERGKRTSGN